MVLQEKLQEGAEAPSWFWFLISFIATYSCFETFVSHAGKPSFLLVYTLILHRQTEKMLK